MTADTRLNLLLTPPASPKAVASSQPWHQTMTRLLVPLGVRTFEAATGPEAMNLIEKVPIHLAVVDTRLPAISGLSVCQLIQRLREKTQPAPTDTSSPAPPASSTFRFQMKVEEQNQQGQTQRRIEVRFDSRPADPKPAGCGGPVVILIAPPPGGGHQDRALLQEALKFNAFSVLAEPVDVNLALDVLARAMKRFHQNQWPTQ